MINLIFVPSLLVQALLMVSVPHTMKELLVQIGMIVFWIGLSIILILHNRKA